MKITVRERLSPLMKDSLVHVSIIPFVLCNIVEPFGINIKWLYNTCSNLFFRKYGTIFHYYSFPRSLHTPCFVLSVILLPSVLSIHLNLLRYYSMAQYYSKWCFFSLLFLKTILPSLISRLTLFVTHTSSHSIWYFFLRCSLYCVPPHKRGLLLSTFRNPDASNALSRLHYCWPQP